MPDVPLPVLQKDRWFLLFDAGTAVKDFCSCTFVNVLACTLMVNNCSFFVDCYAT